MTLPKPPPRRRIPGLSLGRRSTASTPERLRRMTEEHEEKERPFDPERRGSWRGSGRELVVNPNQFHKDLRELVDASKLAEPDEAFEKAKTILKGGGDENDVMNELNELLDMHGVEAFPSQKLPHPDFLYLNSGDTYNATLVYSYADDKYFVSTFGDIVENAEPEMEDESWGDWLESEVRKQLEAEIENDLYLSDAAKEAILGKLEDIESERLHGRFVEALNEAGGQVTFESDGSVFVYKQEAGIEALAKELIEESTAVPEQTSFGFNPRRRNGGAMTAEEFMALLKAEADVRGRSLRMRFEPRSGQLFVDLYNLPELPAGERRDGAEAANNRFMFVVDGFSSGRVNFGQGTPIAATKVKLEQSINSAGREYRLRGKSGAPDQVARYLAAHLTKIAAGVEPKYTHSRAPNARSSVPKVEWFTGKTIDARVTLGGIEYERTVDGEWETYGGGADGSAVRDPEFRAELDELVSRSRAANGRGRRRKVTYRVRGTADDHRDRNMMFGRSSRTLTGEFDTEPEAMRKAEGFMQSEAPAGREAKVWIEKSWPSGDFSVLGKWVGEGGRWVPAR